MLGFLLRRIGLLIPTFLGITIVSFGFVRVLPGDPVLLITHDMGVIAELADEVAVMYMGIIVEAGTVDDVLRRPRHPYTRGLLDSIPVLGRGKNQDIKSIRGATPDAYDRPVGCQFAPRCHFATEACNVMPVEEHLTDTHRVMCHHSKEVFPDG